jgi:hypothetical protein
MQYNALQSLQAFEMGQGQRKQREYDDGRKKLGNALAGGDYAGGASMAYGMGDIETGMALQGQQKSMLDAQAEERRNAMISAVMSLSGRAEGEERQAFVPQVLETLRLKGVELSPEMLSQMDLSTGALQATLKALQDPDTLMAQYQKAQEPYTLAPGARRYGPDGREIAANPKPEARFRPLTPEEARSAGLPSNSGYQVNEQTGEIKAVGREASSLVNINTGDGTPRRTVFEEATDKKIADEYAAWITGGGSDAVKQIAQLQSVKDRLDAGEPLTGSLLGLVSPNTRILFNEGSVDAQQLVEEVVQRNLRLILGAQFTEREGERLIARAYNPQARGETNSKRVGALINQISLAAQQKQALFDHVEKYGTATGFRGTTPSIEDFFAAIRETDGGVNQPTPLDPDEINSLVNQYGRKK